MTTEVLRNMIYADAARLAGLRLVVLDEVHYLEDRYRGSVWEEIILSRRAEVVLVCLSATVSNAEELAGWIEQVRGSTAHVIEEHRPIELRQHYVVGIRANHRLEILPTFVAGVPNPEAVALDARARPRARPGTGPGGRAGTRALARLLAPGGSRSWSASPRRTCCPRSTSCSPGRAATTRCASAWKPGRGSRPRRSGG